MKHSTLSVRDMAYISLAATLLVISAWISIPVLDIAFTLQTFALYFLLDLLGGRRTTLAFLVYLGLGLAGLPVFSGFQGGAGALLGVTGGYIWGFGLSCLLWWALSPGKGLRLPAAIFGLLLCYLSGSMWFWLVYTGGTAGDLTAVLVKCVIPYLIPDALKLTLALGLSGRIKTIVKL